jgi:predicted nucleic acid-binding protein
MILADTSVWIDHFRSFNRELDRRLETNEVVMHPFVLGELLLSGLAAAVVAYLKLLPPAKVAAADEVAALIVAHPLNGRGIGYVDAALLASARLGQGLGLWTRDRRLLAVAVEMSVEFDP